MPIIKQFDIIITKKHNAMIKLPPPPHTIHIIIKTSFPTIKIQFINLILICGFTVKKLRIITLPELIACDTII